MWRRLLPAAIAAGAIVAALAFARNHAQDADVARLTGAPVPRLLTARISVPTEHRTCTDNGAAGPFTCPSADGDTAALTRAATAARRRPEDADSGARLHARALQELVWAGRVESSVDSSISWLERIAEAGPGAAVLSDLAAAHLTRWELTRSTHDLLAAIDLADRAISLDTSAMAPRYNLGLALERMHLIRSAQSAWADYARRERDPEWRADAGRYAARLGAPSYTKGPPSSDTAAVRRWAAMHRQRARELSMDEWLPAWGAAQLRGADSSHTALARAIAAADGLGQTGDATVRSAVAVIADAGRLGTTTEVALAFASYGAAQAQFGRAAYDSAGVAYENLATGARVPGVLRAWAMSGRAAAAVNVGDGRRSDSLLTRLAADAPARGLVALGGRAHWALGTAALRSGAFGAALREYERAHAAYTSAGETSNAAATRYLVAEAQFRLGDTRAGLASMHDALAALWREGPSVWLHNALYVLARVVDGEDFPRAARWVASEDTAVTARLDSTRVRRELYILEARLGHARFEPAHPDSVGHALADVPRLLSRVSQPALRATLYHQAGVTRARAFSTTAPDSALRHLDAAIAWFRGRNATRLLPALVLRADVRSRQGDTHGAEQDLQELAQILDVERAAVTGEWLRATLLGSARAVHLRLALGAAARGRGDTALAHLERGRRSFGGRAGRRAPTFASQAPRGTTIITHAIAGDTLLTWIIGATGTTLDRRVVQGRALLDGARQLRLALERRDDARALPLLEALYDALLRPVRTRIAPGSTLVVVEDEALAGVPFAALRDRAMRRHVVEDHVVVMAASVAEALAGATSDRMSSMAGDRVLLVGADTAGGGAALLREASREIGQIAAMYPTVARLEGRAATPARAAAAFARAEVVHFAGHAVFDPARPDESHLMLARGADGRERLTARELEHVDLSSLRLIVVASCESMRPDDAGTSYRGVADALLTAGAGGVLGSLWKVEDRATSEVMVHVHRALAGGSAAAAALATAQRAMLASRDMRLAAPSAWAGFGYSGRWTLAAGRAAHTTSSELH